MLTDVFKSNQSTLSGLEEDQGMCMLTLNVLNQYLFLIFWFCLVLIALINCLSLILTVTNILFPSIMLKQFLASSSLDRSPAVAVICKLYLEAGSSLRLLMDILAKNVDPKLFGEILVQLDRLKREDNAESVPLLKRREKKSRPTKNKDEKITVNQPNTLPKQTALNDALIRELKKRHPGKVFKMNRIIGRKGKQTKKKDSPIETPVPKAEVVQRPGNLMRRRAMSAEGLPKKSHAEPKGVHFVFSEEPSDEDMMATVKLGQQPERKVFKPEEAYYSSPNSSSSLVKEDVYQVKEDWEMVNLKNSPDDTQVVSSTGAISGGEKNDVAMLVGHEQGLFLEENKDRCKDRGREGREWGKGEEGTILRDDDIENDMEERKDYRENIESEEQEEGTEEGTEEDIDDKEEEDRQSSLYVTAEEDPLFDVQLPTLMVNDDVLSLRSVNFK